MTVTLEDVKYRKSAFVSDAISNGGIKGQVEVISGIRHSLFPRVTKAERLVGLTRYRKEFWCNENADNDIAYGVLQWLEHPSNAGDRFYLKEGSQRDTQVDITSPAAGIDPLFTGAGVLDTTLVGGETSISLQMESDDFYFGCGSILHLSDKIRTSQSIGSTVVTGNSVAWDGADWNPITATTDITYPNGIYLGSNKVLTAEAGSHEEWLEVADNLTTDEAIGTGNGISAVPELATLVNITKGIDKTIGKLPVVTTLNTSDGEMTAYINQDGSVDTVNSDASAGQLNMDTGVWVTDITWDTNVKDTQDILVTYHERAFVYASNVVTIALETPTSNSYVAANSSASGCVQTEEVVASFEDWETTTAGGEYDETTLGNIVVNNIGAVEDDITLTFTSGALFSLSGTNMGVIGTGYSIAGSVSPTHPVTGLTLFTISNAGWSGSWLAGDTIEFTLHPSAQGVWLKEVIPASTVQENNNLVILGWYSE